MSVDIILPTYNRAHLLPETLASVQDQTYQNWICWVSEDGDTIATREAIAPFLQDQRFRYLPGAHTGLPAAVRNRAIAFGESEYVAFLDDDDIWLPTKLERQINSIEESPSRLLIGANAWRWFGEIGDGILERYLPETTAWGAIDYERFVESNILINSSVLMRREVVARIGFLSESPLLRGVEDYEYWLRVAMVGDTFVDEAPLLYYRDTPASSIRGDDSDLHKHYETLANTLESVMHWLIRHWWVVGGRRMQYFSILWERLKFMLRGPDRVDEREIRWRLLLAALRIFSPTGWFSAKYT